MRSHKLRDDQWELIVLALQHVRHMTTLHAPTGYEVDKVARKFLRARCDEIVQKIAPLDPTIPSIPKDPPT